MVKMAKVDTFNQHFHHFLEILDCEKDMWWSYDLLKYVKGKPTLNNFFAGKSAAPPSLNIFERRYPASAEDIRNVSKAFSEMYWGHQLKA